MGYGASVVIIFGVELLAAKSFKEEISYKTILPIIKKLWPFVNFDNEDEHDRFWDEIIQEPIPGSKYRLIDCTNHSSEISYHIALKYFTYEVCPNFSIPRAFGKELPISEEIDEFVQFLKSKEINLPYDMHITFRGSD